DSAAADRAIATAVREGAFVPLREGRFWFRVGFADVATLDRHLAASRRFEGYAPGTRARLVRARPRRVALRRALVFRILQRR
ncbi:MAG: hypothetical protein ACRDF0_00430, partial [Candidatus Limnocylindria bacterium]